jgi:hypothetical protein
VGDVVSTIGPGGGYDYTTAIAWESGLPADLSSDGNAQYGDGYGGDYDLCQNQTLTISGHVTDATNKPIFRAASGEQHSNVWNKDKARCYFLNKTGLNLADDNCLLIGMQIDDSHQYSTYPIWAHAASVVVANNILKLTGNRGPGVYCTGSGDVYIYQNIIYATTQISTVGAGIENKYGGNTFIYNNTVINCYDGVSFSTSTGSGCEAKNNLIQDSYNNDYSTTASVTTADNITSDTTSPDSLGSITLTFADKSGHDYHLDSGDTEAINDGTDLSAVFTTDAEGNDRTAGSYFGIGASLYTTSGTTYDETPADSGTGDDSATGALSAEGAATDSGAAGDEAGSGLDAVGGAGDSATAGDAAWVEAVFGATAEDSGVGSDTATPTVDYEVTAADSGNADDSALLPSLAAYDVSDVLAAVSAKFSTSNTLNTALAGKFYRHEAPRGAYLPYGVYTLVVDTPMDSFDGTIENVEIQIDLFSTTAAECDSLYSKCKSLFDDCSLSPTGYTHLAMFRDREIDLSDENLRRWSVNYTIMAEER